jgi:hypothetical protein
MGLLGGEEGGRPVQLFYAGVRSTGTTLLITGGVEVPT